MTDSVPTLISDQQGYTSPSYKNAEVPGLLVYWHVITKCNFSPPIGVRVGLAWLQGVRVIDAPLLIVRLTRGHAGCTACVV